MKKVILVSRNPVPENHRLPLSVIQSHLSCVTDSRQADAILVMGGDGTMLDAISNYQHLGLPFIGLNYGHVGFLMNNASIEVLEEIVSDAVQSVQIQLLKAEMYDEAGQTLPSAFAFNDFYMERTEVQTANIRVAVDGTVLFDPLIADGIIVATAAGSTAYNASAGGTIVPLDASTICLTAISPAIFHLWRSSVLSTASQVTLEALATDQRPVRFLADGKIVNGVQKAVIAASDCYVQLLFVKSNEYRKKVLDAQFGKR